MTFAGRFQAPDALNVATITKLMRNLCLAGAIPFVAWRYVRTNAAAATGRKTSWLTVFPLFVLGFVATFLIVLLIGLSSNPASLRTLNAAMDQANVFRQLFFVLTFFSIGLMSDLRVLWQEGIARLAAVYVVCLFGFVIWVGLLISWLFFSGIHPPLAS